MIHIFRKEMRKWKAVLWLVLVGLVSGGALSMIFFKTKSIDEVRVALVNGAIVPWKTYKQSLAATQTQLASLKEYARMLGLSDEMFLKSFLGASNPYDMALKNCIKEELMDQVKYNFNIELAMDFFKEEFVKSIPAGLLDERGRIKMDSYQAYLERMAMSPADYEERKEEEFKRQLLDSFIANSYYAPAYQLKLEYDEKNNPKKYHIAVFLYDDFEAEVKGQTVTDEQLMKFFAEHKERYRVPMKKQARYWQLSTQNYAKNVDITDESIARFYNKNKSSLFRIAPKVRVRRIMLKKSASDNAGDAFKQAQDIYQQVKQNSERFADLAKKHSQDSQTASNGGLTDFFTRGTYDKNFERAAFRLHKKGEMSDIVTTENGFELIQLDERIKAQEKPLDEVREEVITTLRTKKAVTGLKSELDMLMRSLRSKDASALDGFIKKHGVQAQESELLTQADANPQGDAMSVLAHRLFTQNKRRSKVGYFFDGDGTYTLYELIDEKASFIPPFAEIKGDVLAYYMKREAKGKLKKSVNDAKFSVFNKGGTLQDYAQQHNIKLLTTDFIKAGDEIKGIDDRHLSGQLGILSDKKQLFSHKHGKTYYVAQLLESKDADQEGFIQQASSLADNKKMRNRNVQMRTFIASLQRNAKIDIDQRILKSYQGN